VKFNRNQNIRGFCWGSALGCECPPCEKHTNANTKYTTTHNMARKPLANEKLLTTRKEKKSLER
jgi:hypothetical protein